MKGRFVETAFAFQRQCEMVAGFRGVAIQSNRAIEGIERGAAAPRLQRQDAEIMQAVRVFRVDGQYPAIEMLRRRQLSRPVGPDRVAK